MLKIDIITIFPNLFENFLNESLIARAQKNKILKMTAHDLRRWTNDRHRTVDDRPYGGGAGMVLRVEPIFKAVAALKRQATPIRLPVGMLRTGKAIGRRHGKTRTILLSAKGRQFTQAHARRLAGYSHLIFICGRYEGVDERVAKHIADEELSVGPYILFGGEVAAMAVIEAATRLVPGVVAKEESIKDESFSNGANLEHPQYTRPGVFKPNKGRQWAVPKVLLSGNRKEIEIWRQGKAGRLEHIRKPHSGSAQSVRKRVSGQTLKGS